MNFNEMAMIIVMVISGGCRPRGEIRMALFALLVIVIACAYLPASRGSATRQAGTSHAPSLALRRC